MSARKRKHTRHKSRKQPTTAVSTPSPLTMGKREKSELESVAVQVGQLSRQVDSARQLIKCLESDLANQRAYLATTMMNHQESARRLVELTALNQPVN